MVPRLWQQHRLHLAGQFELTPQRFLLQAALHHLVVASCHHQDVGEGDQEIEVLDHRTYAPVVVRGVAGQHHRNRLVVLVDGHHHV